MSNQISTFNFENQSIRTIAINNEPWFIAKDLCDAINISNYRDAIERLDEDEKGVALTDTLGGKTGSYSQNVEEIRPLEPTYHREHTQTEMLCFASLWFSLYNCRDTLEQVSEPLMALGARLGSTAYTHATEYRNTLGLLQRILVKMLDGIETEEPHYRKALATLRGYQPRGLARIAKR